MSFPPFWVSPAAGGIRALKDEGEIRYNFPSGAGGAMRDKLRKFYTLWRVAGALAALLACLLAPAAPASAGAAAATPEIRDIAVVEKQGRLLAFASLSGGFTPKVLEAIRSGVTTRFTFEIALMRDRLLIYDTQVFRRCPGRGSNWLSATS